VGRVQSRVQSVLSERGLRPRNFSSGEVSEGGAAPRRLKYGAKTPKAGGAA